MFSVITFQIPHLYLDPCLGICFWGIPGHWCLYPFLSGLILCVSHPSLYYQAFEGLLLCVQENITHALACSFCTLYQSPLPPSFCLCEAKTTALAHGQCTEIYKIQGWGGGAGCGVQAPLEAATLENPLGELEGQHGVPRASVALYLYLLCGYISHTLPTHIPHTHHTHFYTHTSHIRSLTYIYTPYILPHRYTFPYTFPYTYISCTHSLMHTHSYIYMLHTYPSQRNTHIPHIQHTYTLHTHYLPAEKGSLDFQLSTTANI